LIRAFLFLFLFLAALDSARAANPLLELADEISKAESLVPGLKSGVRSVIRFARPENPRPTKIAIVYLHGFSASPREVSPLPETLAGQLGANLYMPRYRGHGIEGHEGLRGVSAQEWARETEEALARGRRLGEQVVAIATSTGAALLLPAALKEPQALRALVLISPNFALADSRAEWLRYPGGAWLARWIIGSYRSFRPKNIDHAFYWTPRYPSSILPEVVRAAHAAREAPLEELTVPTLVAYSPRDPIIDLAELKKQAARIPHHRFFEADRTEHPHVIAGQILSPRGTKPLLRAIREFLTVH
jgi:pimeloyl-ACP methyl ester carboxylesterase